MTNPLSIAIVTGSMSRLGGGLFNSVRRSAISLLEAGHAVEVFSIEDEFSDEDRSAWSPLVPTIAPYLGPRALGVSPALGEALTLGEFDVVHQHGIWQGFSTNVSAWRKRAGGPVMISPRGMLDPWALKNSAWKKRLAARLFEDTNLRSAYCLHALNRSEAESMRAYGLKNPIAIIPNGADIPDICDRDIIDRPEWWPNESVLLFIGRIHPKKGLTELVKAYAQFKKHTPETARDWRVVIAGWDDGGHEAALLRLISDLDLEQEIIMPGSLFGAEKDTALRLASAFVLPSFSEGLPMSILEAWAYQLPVLMTDECNLPEGFEVDAAARISREPDTLCQQLASFLSSNAADMRCKMAKNGRALAMNKYSWRSIAKQHADVYQWMKSASGPKPPQIIDY